MFYKFNFDEYWYYALWGNMNLSIIIHFIFQGKTTLWILLIIMVMFLTYYYGCPLWTNLYRGRIVSLLWYLRRGWCDWLFNHDSWVKWGCHDIATCLTQTNTSVGYNEDVFLTSCYITTYVYFLHVFIHIYVYLFFKENTSGLLSRSGSTSLRR